MRGKGLKKIVVYTDGSCFGNGKECAIGGIGIHFPSKELPDLSKVYRLGPCTNQKTELYAILIAIRYIRQNLDMTKHQIQIMTDSQYSISCITEWVPGWIRNGWKTKSGTAVQNRELIESIYKNYKKFSISFRHVDAHTKGTDPESIANAEADRLAVRATKRAQREGVSFSKSSKGSSRPCPRPSHSSKHSQHSRFGSKTSRPTTGGREVPTRRRPSKYIHSKGDKTWNNQELHTAIIELVDASD